MREYSEDIDSNLPHQNKQSEALDAPLSLDSFAFDVSDEFSFSSSPGSGDSMKHPQDVNRQEPLITSLPFFSPSLSQTSYAIYKGILTGKSEVSVGLQSFIHNNFLKSTLSAPVLSSISKVSYLIWFSLLASLTFPPLVPPHTNHATCCPLQKVPTSKYHHLLQPRSGRPGTGLWFGHSRSLGLLQSLKIDWKSCKVQLWKVISISTRCGAQ